MLDAPQAHDGCLTRRWQVLIKTADYHRRKMARWVRAGLSRTPPPSQHASETGEATGNGGQAPLWGTPESGSAPACWLVPDCGVALFCRALLMRLHLARVAVASCGEKAGAPPPMHHLHSDSGSLRAFP